MFRCKTLYHEYDTLSTSIFRFFVLFFRLSTQVVDNECSKSIFRLENIFPDFAFAVFMSNHDTLIKEGAWGRLTRTGTDANSAASSLAMQWDALRETLRGLYWDSTETRRGFNLSSTLDSTGTARTARAAWASTISQSSTSDSLPGMVWDIPKLVSAPYLRKFCQKNTRYHRNRVLHKQLSLSCPIRLRMHLLMMRPNACNHFDFVRLAPWAGSPYLVSTNVVILAIACLLGLSS